MSGLRSTTYFYRTFWRRDLAYQEILEAEAETILQYLLEFDIDPLMFHQANLASYDGTHSLLSDLIERVLAKYNSLYGDVPICCLGMHEIGEAMAARAVFDAAEIQASLVHGSGLVLTSDRDVIVPITGIQAGETIELYASQHLSAVALRAHQPRKIPMSKLTDYEPVDDYREWCGRRMSQSQPTDQQRLHVAMITEGTYPFHFGGVSTWCHLLLGDLWDVDFTLISLVGSPDAELQFPLPSNVIDFRPIPLWGVREAAENRSRLGLTELLDAKARTSEQAITHEFIPQFRSFLHELYADKADLGRLAESIHGMYKFFVAHDFDRTLRSKAAWQCFLAETQEFFPRMAAQHGYPGAAFSLADVGRAMQWLYHWFFPLAQPLPKADVAHLAMAGLCTLIATAMKLEYGYVVHAHRAWHLSA